ncbi:hypothetical protein [Arthrobacter gengyunqii]|uniref:Uncharacterized protein n=1 Tax=Arthrobacter gengyunqii TaxID=2886940 RepID=A0ABS8GNH7_9MICC|nr:hypothetical protein [Arthrobacter gengyunqii]MCC3267728.1 hypothetical protein [Arthrobacter gengyunqii]
MVYSEQYGGQHTILLTDFEGSQVWSVPAPAHVVDLAITATQILVSTDEAVVEIDPGTGASRDAAPGGTTLLGYKNPLSGHATYLPDQRGLAEADGGQLVDPRPLVLRMLNSCSDDAVCSGPSVLLADREHALITVPTGDVSTGDPERTLTAFTSDGDPAWTLPGTPNSAVRYQDTYVLGFDGDAAGPARLIAVNAQTGEKIGESLFSGDKAMVLGAVDQGVLVRYAADVGGAYDSMQTVLAVTVTEGELAAREEPSSSSSSAGPRTAGSGESAGASGSSAAPRLSGTGLPPGWSTYEGEDDPFRLDLPPDWSVEFVPGDGAPVGNRYTFRDGDGVESAGLMTNMSGLGGMCGGSPPWPVSEHRIALPHMNRAATAIAKEPLYLETVADEQGGFSYRVTDLLGHPGVCPIHKLAEPGGGLGTTSFSGQITASEQSTASGLSSASGREQSKAAELRAMMLSFRVER